ncbi:MAG: histidine phosphatase family protein [Lachnospiraceae bacterium]|nr:histidine phosphatase family protein [Lachnospiraceae bacterium]
MRLLFVRHGEPNYEKDCLTPTGVLQAKNCAKRLLRENIDEIYSSPMGRARQTAEETAKLLGKEVTVLDYMYEIWWGGEGIPEEGHLWTLGDMLTTDENFDYYTSDWKKHPFFEKNYCMEFYDKITGKIDEFLLSKGYKHDGRRFYCDTDENKNIAIFSHGGSGACAMSHILSLPLPYFASVFPYDFTSVIIIDLPVNKGSFVRPRMELFNDAAHIIGISDGLKLQQKVDKK